MDVSSTAHNFFRSGAIRTQLALIRFESRAIEFVLDDQVQSGAL